MSDTPSDPTGSRRHRREPATISLSATEIRDETPPVPAGADAAEESPAAASEPATSGNETTPTPDEVIPSDDVDVTGDDAARSGEHVGVASAPPPSAERRRGLGFGALLAAGLMGGVVGAGAALLTEGWWRPRVTRLDTRLAEVEQRLAAPQNPLGPIESRLSGLETQDKALAERIAALQASVERNAKAAQERAAAAPAGSAAAAAESGAAVGDLAARVAALDAQAQERAKTSADVQSRMAAVEAQAQERAKTSADVQSRIAAIEGQAQEAAAAAQTLERRLADQDQRIAALAKQFSERGPDAMVASLRITLADRLSAALDDGAPLGQLLALLRRLEAKPEALKPLEPYTQSGAPTAAALAREFRPVGQRMIAESRPGAGDWDERLWRMLDKVVTVRAIGDDKANDVASIVTRVEEALSRDSLADAAAAWDALPEQARATSQEWGTKLKQRAEAEAASQRIYEEALAALDVSTR